MTGSRRLFHLITRIRARSPLHSVTSAAAAAAALRPAVRLDALRTLSTAQLGFSSSAKHRLLHHHLFADQFVPPDIGYEVASYMGKASKGSYYAVQKGQKPGIYSTWPECEANIKGFAGAVYKKFYTEAEAHAFLKGDGYGASSRASGVRSSTSTASASDNPRASLHPHIATLPPVDSSRIKKHAPPPSTVLGKRHSDHRNESAPSKRSHIDPVFPPPAESSSASGSKRKSVVYCDGSSIGNGKKGARAGWGVFFQDPDLHHLNESRRLPGPVQTNNRAELTAIIRAIQLCPDDGRQLLICSDSQYSMNAVNKWLPGWKRNGFKTSSGGEVQNIDLILQLEQELQSRYPHPKLEYVKAHSGIDGNEIVDRMAKFGASLPEEDSKDLDKRSSAPEANVKHVDWGQGVMINISVTPTKKDALQGGQP